MRLFSYLIGLPASLLLLLLLLVAPHVAHAQANARGPLPTAIRKMSPDAGEKLLQEYLAFAAEDQAASIATADANNNFSSAANSSAMMVSFSAPFAPHFHPGLDARDNTGGSTSDAHDAIAQALSERSRDAIARLLLGKRDYACPAGTSSCVSIGHPDSCCQAGTACEVIADTGLGPVGCCPDGIRCAGSIACSGSQEGCPSDVGGGCCIEGYVCASVGCVQRPTTTATVMQTSTIVSTVAGSPPTTVTTIAVSQSSPASASTGETTTSTPPSSTFSPETPTSITKTTTPSPSPSPSTQTQTPTSSSPSAPVRPTSLTTTSSPATPYCPTGFYACSAVHGGGCCQTGRDCQTTSCPPTASTSIIIVMTSGGETVAVPLTDVPSSAPTSASTCAGGWSLCPTGAGATAGCCPAGYSCGTASCFLTTGSATASVAKELTGSGVVKSRVGCVGLMMIPVSLGFVFGMALV